jgi:transcriptional regulator with XRE-family HTH domain
MGIGRRIRTKRKALELKQNELAKAVKVTPQHISQLELEKAAPALDKLLPLSRALGVSTDYLLTGKEIAPLDATGAIRSEPGVSAAAKKHLIGVLEELRKQT